MAMSHFFRVLKKHLKVAVGKRGIRGRQAKYSSVEALLDNYCAWHRNF
jgi:hypothetical protein